MFGSVVGRGIIGNVRRVRSSTFCGYSLFSPWTSWSLMNEPVFQLTTLKSFTSSINHKIIPPYKSPPQFAKKWQNQKIWIKFVNSNKYSTTREQTEQLEVLEQPGRKSIVIWLLLCCGMVFVMVVLGGVTRLTESGLSITEWKPFRGAIPPKTQEEWEEEFAKYKQSPEYLKMNYGMKLEDFKRIFWMEWAHRQWGRIIGIAFGLPFAFFMAKGWLKGRMLLKCCGLLALGASQGALGWYMVKSGLDHQTFEETNSVPRVSQYRLAAHLTAAIAVYAAMLWMSMDLMFPKKYVGDYGKGVSTLKRWGAVTTGLIALTAFSGAFVAGLDAGLVYNTFPLMAGQVIPEGLFKMKPLWKNFFENDTTVQFNHRMLGMTTFGSVSILYLFGIRNTALPKYSKLSLHLLFGAASLQVLLGISTLLSYVPVPLAASHQANALSLLGISLWTLHQLRRVPVKQIPR